MGLRIIYGRAGSGKSRFCFEDMASRIKTGYKRLIMIVPEQYSLQAEKRMVNTLGASGVNNIEVLSFRRLAYRVLSETGGINRTRMNQAGKCMLLYSILDKYKEELKVFGFSAGRKGFANTLSGVISELKRYNVTPELLNSVKMAVGNNDMLAGKLEDIYRVYSEYEEIISSRYADSDDDLTLLSHKISECTFLDNSEIWIDGFSGFTPQEYAVIGELMKKAEALNISLCTDCIEDSGSITGMELFAPVMLTAYRILRLAKDNAVEILKPVNVNGTRGSRFESAELEHLEKNLFNFTYGVYRDKTKDISVFKASGIYSEVEDTARDILLLCREKNIRFREIAVVSGNLEAYERIISAVFAQYGIPCFIDSKRNIMGHPMIALVMSALHIHSSNWSYEAVFRYLKTGLTGIERYDIDLLENYVLAYGIRGSKWTREEDWIYGYHSSEELGEQAAYDNYTVGRVNEVRKQIVQPLKNFYSKAKGRKKVKELSEALFLLLCDIKVPETIQNCVDSFRLKGQLDQANEYAQIWNVFVEVLDQIVEVAGDELISLDKYAELLDIGLNEYKMGVVPPALEQVVVGSIDRSKSQDIKAIYILGVNDGVFPSSEKDEGLLSDMERIYLKELGIELAPDTRSKVFEQQFMIYSVFAAPSKYLRLSYAAADNDGKTLRSSNIISGLRRLFPKLNIYSDIDAADSNNDFRKISSPQPTFNEVIGAMRKKAEGQAVPTIWKSVYKWYLENEKWKAKCEAAISAFSHTNNAENISMEKTKKLYGSKIYTSVSRLEKYAACPFSYYVEYGLKAKERKIFRLSAPDMGTFLHEVLDRLSRTVQEKGMSWRTIDRQWCMDSINEIVEQLLIELQNTVYTGSDRYKYLTERLKRILVRAVWIIAEQIKRGGFEPVGYELGFGVNEKLPPITVELPGGESIVLNGRIDRVDAFKTEQGTYLRIVDYKSGSKAFKLSDIYHGLQIQLVAYLDNIWQNGIEGAEGEIIPAGMLYLKLDDPMIKGERGATAEEIEKQIMKQLRMKGLLLADVKLIREMDRQIEGDSLVIPARINKDESLGRSSAATLEQFELLRSHVRRLLQKLGQEMLSGNINISPYKYKRHTPCLYCSYKPVCRFDPSMKDNSYRLLNDKKDDEVWEVIGGATDEQL
ncbi:MAG: helicase-exonuclease AddAB subunit AddB [Bacillota bacterium]